MAVAVIVACASPAVTPTPAPPPVTLADAVVPENLDVYRNTGFVVGAGALPFVGQIRFAATEYVDSTSVIVALSLPPRSLSFVRAGDRYAAFYAIRIDLLQGDAILRSDRTAGEVRVASFAETTRGDEGIIFQRGVRVAPGTYSLRLTAEDSLGAGTGTATVRVTVPSLSEGTFSSVMPVFVSEPRRARSSPVSVVVNPKASARYGRDSIIELYVEAYGQTPSNRIAVEAVRPQDPSRRLFADSITLSSGTTVRTGRLIIPLHRLDLGMTTIITSLPGKPPEPLTIFVTLGIELPVESIAELLDALRSFTSEGELQRLRLASPEARPALWTALLRRTDPDVTTPDNEAFLEYARRLRVAERFYREGLLRGWQTDRGGAVTALGEPDHITEPLPADSTGAARVVTWEYRRHRLFLVFGEATGSGVWRLTPISAADLRSFLSLTGPCAGCR